MRRAAMKWVEETKEEKKTPEMSGQSISQVRSEIRGVLLESMDPREADSVIRSLGNEPRFLTAYLKAKQREIAIQKKNLDPKALCDEMADTLDPKELCDEVADASEPELKQEKRETQTRLALLKKIALFNRFSQREKLALSRLKGTFMKYSQGTLIVEEGTFGATFFVLIKGVVVVTQNIRPRVVLARLSPGSLFGEVSFLTRQKRASNVIAGTDVVVMQFSRPFVHGLTVKLREKVKDMLIEIVAGRLDDMNKMVLTLSRKLSDSRSRPRD